jgi:rod shape determining protein RodA
MVLFVVNPKLYSTLAWLIYGGSLFLLLAVIFLGIEVNGSNSWFEFGPVRFQPAEISKIATTMALASLMSSYSFRLKSFNGMVMIALLIFVPMAIIVMQKETGSALIYGAFIFMLYREGLSGWYISLGILAILLFLITLSFSLIILLRYYLLSCPVKYMPPYLFSQSCG